jgi:DNA-binding MarR family transcriptional regulator
MGTTEQDADPFVDAVAQLTFVVHRLLTDTASRHDLSVTQLRLLGILRDREPTMQELARRLHLDKSSVTGLIDRAERRGLLQRQTDPRDGRGVRVAITAVGRKVARVAAAQVSDALALVAEPLSAAQRDQLVEGSRAIVAHAAALESTDSSRSTGFGS